MPAPPGMECGDVLRILDYPFSDGCQASSKYLVVMGWHLEQVTGFLTTSKEKWGRQRIEGCHPELGKYPSNYYLKVRNTPFHAGTWILLQPEFHSLPSVEGWKRRGKVACICTLSRENVNALKNCFRRSLDWAGAYEHSLG